MEGVLKESGMWSSFSNTAQDVPAASSHHVCKYMTFDQFVVIIIFYLQTSINM